MVELMAAKTDLKSVVRRAVPLAAASADWRGCMTADQSAVLTGMMKAALMEVSSVALWEH